MSRPAPGGRGTPAPHVAPSQHAAGALTVLHIVAPAPVGGLERVVHGLASGHRAHGHRVHVAAVLDAGRTDHPWLGSLAASGVDVEALPLPARAYGRERAEVAALCRRLRPDVVHTHGYRPDVVDGGIARRLGIPTLSTVHGFTRGGWRNQFYESLQRRAFRRFDAVVAVSRPQVVELERSGVPRERIRLIPNAWIGGAGFLPPADARRALGVPEGVFHIGWVGRLSREKGADVLLDAVALLDDLPLVVSFLGDGRERAALEARAAALPAGPGSSARSSDPGAGDCARVRWHGLVGDAAAFFPAFDLFVLSSRTEGTPIALFEAMAAGVPVVATAVGGVPDVVTAAEAILVPPESPGALAEAIRRVHGDPAGAAERAAAARTRLDTVYGYASWLERYERLYRDLAGQALRTGGHAAGRRGRRQWR